MLGDEPVLCIYTHKTSVNESEAMHSFFPMPASSHELGPHGSIRLVSFPPTPGSARPRLVRVYSAVE